MLSSWTSERVEQNRSYSISCCKATNVNKRFSPVFVITEEYLAMEGKPLKCGKCSSVFKTLEQFIQHTKRKIHTEPPQAGELGAQIHQSSAAAFKVNDQPLSSVQTAYASEGPTGKLHRCDWCNISFANQANLATHVHIHIGKEAFKCPVCEYRCAQRENLTLHMKANHHIKILQASHSPEPLGVKEYKCDECERSFNRPGHLIVHKRIHTREQPFKCVVCDRSFTQSGNLNRHLVGQHNMPPMPNLGRSYKQMEIEKMAQMTNPNGQSSLHIVDTNESGSQSYLVQNCKVVNQKGDGSDRIVSSRISKRFTTNQWNKDEPIDCELCNVTYMNKAQFSRHMEIHNQKNKPYKCPECEYQSMKRESCIKHFLGHSTIKPYKCGLCPLSFVSKYRLERHLGIHMEHSQEELKHLQEIFGSERYQDVEGSVVTIQKKERKIKREPGVKSEPQESVDQDDADSHETFPYTDRPHSRCSDDVIDDATDENGEDPATNRDSGESPAKGTSPDQHNKSSIAFMQNILKVDDPVYKRKLAAQKRKVEKWKVQAAKKPFRCGLCSRAFAEQDALMAHMLRHTGQTKPYQCSHCSKRFRFWHNLKLHMTIHTGERNYECDVCKKRFRYHKSFKEHSIIHSENALSCNQCGKKFPLQKYLDNHLKRHSEVKYKCDQCSSTFIQKNLMERHRRRVHSGEKPYECDQCDQTFSLSSSLRTHKLRHVNKNPNHTCEDCGKVFNMKSNLFVHQRIHVGLKPFECEYCGRSFTHSQAMMSHMRTHGGAVKFPCELCNKTFIQQLGLERHMLKHSGEKPFACEQCDKVYTSRVGLKQHMRLKHGEQSTIYKCDVCFQTFGTKTTLKVHQRIHSGEKPYQCSLCDRSFAQSGNLNKHLKEHGTVPKTTEKVKTKKKLQVPKSQPGDPRVVVMQEPQSRSLLSRQFVITK